MPLASQLSNLFSAGSTASNTTANPSAGGIDFSDRGGADLSIASDGPYRDASLPVPGLSDSISSNGITGLADGQRMKSEDVEAEGRPPYVHVGYICSCICHS